jgi:hypothetical protein
VIHYIISAILSAGLIYFFSHILPSLADKKRWDQFVKIVSFLSLDIYNPNNIYYNMCTIGLKKLKIKLGENEELVFYDHITQEGKYPPKRFEQDINRYVYVYSIYVGFTLVNKQIQTLHIYMCEIPRHMRPYLENELQKINEENNSITNKDINKPYLSLRFNGPISVVVDYSEGQGRKVNQTQEIYSGAGYDVLDRKNSKWICGKCSNENYIIYDKCQKCGKPFEANKETE